MDVDAGLAALTSTAASTVVQLLATSAWKRATGAVVGLWRHAHPERAQTVATELADSRAKLLAARQSGDGQAEQALVAEWHDRLRRLATADPQVMDELARVVAELRSALAEADARHPGMITMQATAFSGGQVNQAGRDLHVTTGE